jgi:hypothetical protein
VGVRLSAPVQTGPWAHPASCTMGTGSLPGVKSGHGVTLTPHPLLVPLSRKCRAIRLLPVWAVQPVQSLSACTRVHFTLLLPFLSPESPYTTAIPQRIQTHFSHSNLHIHLIYAMVWVSEPTLLLIPLLLNNLMLMLQPYPY